MAGSGKRGGDRVLESRHLVSLFLGVVLLCAVFFTLGYVMGHNQYGGAVHASDAGPEKSEPPVRAAAKPRASDDSAAPAPANSEWDFYSKNANNNHIDDRMDPVAKASSGDATASPAANARTVPASAHYDAPHLLKGSVVLQVAAVTHQSDALAMADALQQKHFPSFVVAPTTDNFFRVQVGPYQDEKAADAAKAALDHAGFQAIIKH